MKSVKHKLPNIQDCISYYCHKLNCQFYHRQLIQLHRIQRYKKQTKPIKLWFYIFKPLPTGREIARSMKDLRHIFKTDCYKSV